MNFFISIYSFKSDTVSKRSFRKLKAVATHCIMLCPHCKELTYDLLHKCQGLFGGLHLCTLACSSGSFTGECYCFDCEQHKFVELKKWKPTYSTKQGVSNRNVHVFHLKYINDSLELRFSLCEFPFLKPFTVCSFLPTAIQCICTM